MTPEHEAAALWGAAQNLNFTVEERLACALQALKYFGADRRESADPGCNHENHIAECADCGAKPLEGLR